MSTDEVRDTGRRTAFDVGVIGGGSATEAFVRALDGSGLSVVMFEPKLVGGECPFVACMPSKSMLHDAQRSASWGTAVERRTDVVDRFDDSGHRRNAEKLGATIISAAATIVGERTVRADGIEFDVDHLVIASGATTEVPEIDGIDRLGAMMWTSEDALTATERPDRLVVVGGGVIGSEISQIYAGLGSTVTVIDPSERPAEDLHEEVSRLIIESHKRCGVDVHYGTEVRAIDVDEVSRVATVITDDGTRFDADKVLFAVGRRPNTRDLGLVTLGLDADDLTVEDSGRVVGPASLWIMGDAAGREQYTHVANQHAEVVANHIAGDGSRTFGDSVIPACIFISPPVMVVGPTWADLLGDDDVVWATTEVDVPRSTTDGLDPGFIAIAARRSSGTVVAAHGIGPQFDELSHAIVVAIDGQVPVPTLARTIQPFPTVGEVLGIAYADLAMQLRVV
jgi:pyruvate/2-oxoglutarate dehydrogenase complex dihydrolipoamide dehydrogenase (E3) component